MALDVLAREIRERLRPTLLDLPLAGILALADLSERIGRLLAGRRKAQRRKPAERQAPELLAHPVHQNPRPTAFGGDAKPETRIVLVPHVEPTRARRLECADGPVGQRDAAERAVR